MDNLIVSTMCMYICRYLYIYIQVHAYIDPVISRSRGGAYEHIHVYIYTQFLEKLSLHFGTPSKIYKIYVYIILQLKKQLKC